MKHLQLLFAGIPLLFSLLLQAQDWSSAGARECALGSASVALIDPWSVHNNQAAMAFLSKSACSFDYQSRFILQGTGIRRITGVAPTLHGTFGIQFTYSGDRYLNSTLAGLAYARRIGYKFAAGISLDFIRVKLSDGYGTRLTPTFETGFLLKVSDHLTFAAHVFNPIPVRLSKYADERIPWSTRLGFAYEYSGQLLFTLESRKFAYGPVELLSGMEYRFFDKGFARVGCSTNPVRPSVGFGVETNTLQIDLSTSYHPYLGFSPQVSLLFRFSRAGKVSHS